VSRRRSVDGHEGIAVQHHDFRETTVIDNDVTELDEPVIDADQLDGLGPDHRGTAVR
jgi:hypothetical protein